MIKRVAILTDLTEFHDGYSLTHVIRNQVEMLTKYGHDVTLFVSEDFLGELSTCHIDACIPSYEKIRYVKQSDLTECHKDYAKKLAHILVGKLESFDFVFSHDWIFTATRLPLAEALRHLAPETKHLSYFHWIHSFPNGWTTWRDLTRYGNNHRIVYPNATHAPLVADIFKCDLSDVVCIPHIVDLRTMFDFSQEARDFIDAYPGLLSAKFVQIYPAAADRLKDKGLRNLILLFKTLKTKDSVFLLVVDSLSGVRPREDLAKYWKIARNNGLSSQEFAFTSEFKGKYDRGLPRKVLLELMQCSNLFVFPSLAESFGLTFPEASLAGGVIPVLNHSLSPMMEVGGSCGLYYPFGSSEHTFTPSNQREYFDRVVNAIYDTATKDQSWKVRTLMRQKYNMDRIYSKYYRPILTSLS